MALTLTNVSIGSEMSENPIMFNENSKIFDDYSILKTWFKDKEMNVL